MKEIYSTERDMGMEPSHALEVSPATRDSGTKEKDMERYLIKT